MKLEARPTRKTVCALQHNIWFRTLVCVCVFYQTQGQGALRCNPVQVLVQQHSKTFAMHTRIPKYIYVLEPLKLYICFRLRKTWVWGLQTSKTTSENWKLLLHSTTAELFCWKQWKLKTTASLLRKLLHRHQPRLQRLLANNTPVYLSLSLLCSYVLLTALSLEHVDKGQGAS